MTEFRMRTVLNLRRELLKFFSGVLELSEENGVKTAKS